MSPTRSISLIAALWLALPLGAQGLLVRGSGGGGGSACPTTFGLAFRQTSGYVTDAAQDTYVLHTDTYPTARTNGNGLEVTFGYTAGTPDARDRSLSVDPKFAGMNFSMDSGTFRIDLPDGAGTYDVRVAFGDATTSGGFGSFDLNDGATSFVSCTASTTAANRYIDASCTERTEATWLASGDTPVTEIFSEAYFSFDDTNANARPVYVEISCD